MDHVLEIYALFMLLGCFALVYSVLGIELTLYWNGVTEVYSVRTTGQLIPLTIGACGLAQFLYAPAVDVSRSICRFYALTYGP